MKEKFDSHTAKFLRKIMQELDIRYQRHLGIVLGISEDKISRYLKSERMPTYITACKIKKALQVIGVDVQLEDIISSENANV